MFTYGPLSSSTTSINLLLNTLLLEQIVTAGKGIFDIG